MFPLKHSEFVVFNVAHLHVLLHYAALADPDHFGDLNEMILDPLSAVKTGCAGLLDNRLKVPVIRVPQHPCEITARPKLVAGHSF